MYLWMLHFFSIQLKKLMHMQAKDEKIKIKKALNH